MKLKYYCNYFMAIFLLSILAHTGYSATQVEQPKIKYTIIDFPNSPETFASKINNQGIIVGSYSLTSDPSQFMYNLFWYYKGSYHSLLSPLGNHYVTQFPAINDRNQIVGWYMSDRQHGFVFDKGKYSIFDHPAAVYGSGINDNNNRGNIVGGYVDSEQNVHNFIYKNDNFLPIDEIPNTVLQDTLDINDKGQMIGVFADKAFNAGSFLMDNQGIIFFNHPNSEAGTTFANAINNRSQVVGSYQDAVTGKTRIFLYEKGRYTDYAAPDGAIGANATGINDKGQIVGFFYDSFFRTKGFLLEFVNHK